MTAGEDAAIATAYVIAYVALDWISYLYPLAPFAITPWNPPPGLSVALLTIAGLRFWPAVLIAVLLAEILVRGGGSHPLSTTATSLAFAVGYVGVAAVLLRVVRFDPQLRRVRDVVWLVAVAVNGSVVIAAAYVGLLVSVGALALEAALSAALRLWVGDAIGIVVTAPLIMLLVARDPPALFDEPWAIAEAALQSLAVLATLLAVLVIGAGSESRYFYLLFLPLIWISLRHGLRGAVLCLVVIQLGLIIGYQFSPHAESDVLELQLLMLAIAITGLMLGSAVSERLDTLDALGTREAELSTVVDTAPDAILAIDSSGVVTAANRAAEAMFMRRRERIVGGHLSQFISSDGHIEAAVRNVEVIGIRAGGERFPAEASFSRTALADRSLQIGVVRDISERKAMEERLRERERVLGQAIRLASVGELASALAHELNQPLAAIANYVRGSKLLLEAKETRDPKLDDVMGRALAEVTRAADVVRRLREYFRTGASRLERIDLQAIVAGATKQWLERARRDGVQIDTTMPDELPSLLADRVQMEIVMHNLLSNAFDSVLGAADGRRRIDVVARREGKAQIRVTVTDSGPGLTPDRLPSLFQPFATTKPGGMGLGLSISRSMVENHGGRIWAEPLDSGAAFHFTLRIDDRADEAKG